MRSGAVLLARAIEKVAESLRDGAPQGTRTERIARQLAALRSIAVSGIVLFVISLLVIAWFSASKATAIIEEVHLPSTVVQAGYTENDVANQIRDRIYTLLGHAENPPAEGLRYRSNPGPSSAAGDQSPWDPAGEPATSLTSQWNWEASFPADPITSDVSIPSVDIAGTALSLRELVRMTRRVIGRGSLRTTIHVRGQELEDLAMVQRIHMPGSGAGTSVLVEASIEELIDQAAYAVLAQLSHEEALVDGLHAWGIQLVREGDSRVSGGEELYAEALRRFDAAVKIEANDPSLHNDIGLTHLRRGNFREAATSFGRAAQLEASDVYYRNWAGALASDNSFREAHDNYARATQEEPGDADVYVSWGNLFFQEGLRLESEDPGRSLARYNLAVSKYAIAVGLDADNVRVYFDQCAALLRISQLGALENATVLASAFEKALEIDPDKASRLLPYLARPLRDAGLNRRAYSLSERVMAAIPSTKENLNGYYAYNAACFAALISQEDALDEAERRRWRGKALEWLGVELAALGRLYESGGDPERIAGRLLYATQEDTDLGALRAPLAEDVGAEEAESIKATWDAFDQLRRTASGTSRDSHGG